MHRLRVRRQLSQARPTAHWWTVALYYSCEQVPTVQTKDVSEWEEEGQMGQHRQTPHPLEEKAVPKSPAGHCRLHHH